MSGRSLKALFLVITLVTVATASTIKDDDTLQKLSHYREWSRVTPMPVLVDFPSAAG